MESTSAFRIHLVQDRQGATTGVAAQNRQSGGQQLPPCGAATQSGDHIVCECKLHLNERRRNRITGLKQWEDIAIDRPIWVADEEADDLNDRVDGVERFFYYLSFQF